MQSNLQITSKHKNFIYLIIFKYDFKLISKQINTTPTCTKIMNRRSLMAASKTTFVVFPPFRIVGLDVPKVVPAQLVDGLFYFTEIPAKQTLITHNANLTSSSIHNAVVFSHRLRWEIGVGPGTVPVAFNWLRVQRDDHAEFFGYSVEKVAGYPQLVSYADALAGTNLEFPLEENRQKGVMNLHRSKRHVKKKKNIYLSSCKLV